MNDSMAYWKIRQSENGYNYNETLESANVLLDFVILSLQY